MGPGDECLGPQAQEFVGLDWLRLPLQRWRSQRADDRMLAYQVVGACADDHAAFRGIRLEARREIRGVADGKEVPDLRCADVSDDRGPAVEANPEARSLAGERQGTDAALHRQRRASCPQGVVRLRVGSVEDRHHGIAHELHHRPALGEHDRHGRAEGGVEHRHDLRGRCPFGEGGVAAEVGEQDRHLRLDTPQRGAVWVIDQRGRHVRREVGAQQHVDALVQRADQPALREHLSLRAFKQVRPHGGAHDGGATSSN